MRRVVVDLGNTRLKWAEVSDSGRLVEAGRSAPLDDRSAAFRALLPITDTTFAVASVNPPIAAEVELILDAEGAPARWFRAAQDVPVAHRLVHPETAGADRALAVLAAVHDRPTGPGQVIQCGTAITVERISDDGTWLGGAILPGLGLLARSLNEGTAQLPTVMPQCVPDPWGDATESALAAGIFWGAVGALREVLARQSAQGGVAAWRIWTGGDARCLQPHVGADDPTDEDLVLRGLALAAFGARS